MSRPIIFLIIFSMLYSISLAQEIRLTGGEISGNQVWQDVVRIDGDIIIPVGSRVTILPGTRILFNPSGDNLKGGSDKTRCEIIVRGSLIARGQANNKIVFSSASDAPRMSDWYGIQFLHSKSDNAIDYCIVEYGYNGITIKNSQFAVTNSEIRYNYNSGIRTEVKAQPTLSQNIISENGYAGVICELGARPLLTENLITGNPMGIVILSLSQPNLGSVSRGENYNPGKNQFLNNEKFDIYNHSNKPIQAQNNTWENETTAGISVKIYDNEDNNKFGQIAYQPVYNSRAQESSLSRFMILAQDTETPDPNTTLAANTNQGNPGDGLNPGAEPADTSGNILQQIDSTMVNIFEGKVQTTAAPLIASTKPVEPIIESPAPDIEQIDYERIFLEPFLDSRRKKIIHKESIEINSALKNVLQPGVIRVKVIVDQQGRVESASILRGVNEIMDEAILSVVQKYLYEVGKVNGIPVRFSTNEVFRFQ